MRDLATAACLIFMLGVCETRASAGEIEDADFGLRLSAAVSRFSRYPDVAGMGGASAGNRWSSSENPAATGWSPSTGSSGWGGSLQYSGVRLSAGTDLHLLSGSVSYDTDALGAFQAGGLQISTNRATTRQGLEFEWEAQYAEVQWGMRLSDTASAGLNLNWLTTEMRFGLGSTDVIESRGETYGMSVGVLFQQSEDLYLGVVIDYGINPSRSRTFDFMGLGTGVERSRDTLQQALFRPGLCWLVTDDLTVTFDYEFGFFRDDTGRLRVHRFYAGLDQTVIEGVYARAGGVIDTEGNTSLTLGIGIATSESFFLDLAWQRNLFPEIEEEFGGSQVFALSVTILF